MRIEGIFAQKLYEKIVFFMNGQFCNDYSKCLRKDVDDIMDVLNAVGEKKIREAMKNQHMSG